MKQSLRAAAVATVFAASLSGGIAVAQVADAPSVAPPLPPAVPAPPPAPLTPPPDGTLATVRTTHAVDAYGNVVVQKQSTYRDSTGVAQDSTVTQSTRPAPPPPVAVTTTTSTTSTTTAPPQ